ncbi:MAG: hypothetical protein QOJ85_3391, partial [Solirubrobacteraceae bacterium]|nr:hypothetical protein [Solirubrobacteraceae bacterium]
LGLFDTWARFTVVTTRGSRGDGAGGGGGAGPPTGGAAPRAVRPFAAVALPIAGTVRGRLSATVRRPGVYRVRHGDAAGPAVPVR